MSQFALKKAALEQRVAEMDAELEALSEMDKVLEGEDRPNQEGGEEGEEGEAERDAEPAPVVEVEKGVEV